MAVYKRTYKPYTGSMTPEWSRFLILPRFAWRTLFQTRFILILYVVCFFYPIGAAVAIYFNHNVSFLGQFLPGGAAKAGGLFEVGGNFFALFTEHPGDHGVSADFVRRPRTRLRRPHE